MILRGLNLIGFGKFKNKNIELREGINLIYGENEAGKSTIHSFITGMFYGFLKPNVKSTLYTEEYEKYKPWDNSKYAGGLDFQYKNRLYRVERDFTRGEERTKVYDETTGLDITNSIDNGPGRVLQPGLHFFGFNSRVFLNTISIKQLGSKTEDKLANEVLEKLVNVTQSLDDEISIENALWELKNKMAEIGTERASTKPYAKNLKIIEELNEEKEKILLDKEDYDSYLIKKDRLSNELKIEERNLIYLKDNLAKLEIYEKAKKLEEAKILRGEIERLERNAEELSLYNHISIEDYKEAINLTNSIEFLNNNITESETKLKDTIEKLRSIESNIKDYKPCDIEEITKDFNSYEEMEEERNNIIYNKKNNSLEFLRRDFNSNKEKITRYKGIRLFSIVLLIASIILTIISITSVEKNFSISILVPIFFIAWMYYTNKVNKQKLISKDIERQILETEAKEKEKLDRLNNIEISQSQLFEKYNVNSKIEFKRLLDKLQLQYYNNEENTLLYNELDSNRISLIDKINQCKQSKEENIKRLEILFEKNNIKNLQEFGIALEKKSLYEKNIKELEAKEELLNKVLGESTIEDLTVELSNINIDIKVAALDKNQLRYEIERCNERIADYKIALRGIDENINILGKSISRLVEIEEELERRKKHKEELENEYKALELAVETIEKLSKNIHNEFAPDINNKVSKLVEKITNAKYNKVRVDENLNITVENPITKEIIKISDLSGGTIDQLYFSLRFSIINSMVENNFPLILDDCFIQYDDKRLRNIMEFLIDISRERQIILLTCQNREKKILEEFGVEYNFVSLR